MTISVTPMGGPELSRIRILPDAGFGALYTDRGNLPLDRLDVQTKISGLVSRTVVTTEFVNANDTALEATYVFPLPDRAAVTGMTMTADGRTVEAELAERAAARESYDRAVAAGQRASIAEQERPDVFTMRVGNILPGEHVVLELRLVGPLPYEDGAATFRFPLVVAPRYVPGTPLAGTPVGDGTARDTDAVPDASRITPPVLLPGFPNPLRLSIGVDIDPAGLALGAVRSSLHTVRGEGTHLEIEPGERVDRDFILRLEYAAATESAVTVPDESADRPEGTYQLVVLPPDAPESRPGPKDVVLLLDRSGSMGGWKMVAARRAAARVVDTLTAADRFAVLTFDHQVDRPGDLGTELSDATDRHRFRAVEHLAKATARGGTELLAPLHEGLTMLAASARDRVLVLVTDGQVGNEGQLLAEVAPLVGSTRIHTVGIDRAVNAGFLGRLAALGAGRCELVESENRLDEAMEQIHRRIGAPVVTDLSVTADGLMLLDDTRSPHRPPGIYPGVPLVVTGRYEGAAAGTLTVTGRMRDDREFTATVPVQRRDEPAVTAQWARARLRDLEDRYDAGEHDLEPQIVTTSLRFGVLCRFTAYVAVDSRVVNEGGETRRVIQPVELPSGWDAPGGARLNTLMVGSATPLPPPAAPAPIRPSFAPVRAQHAPAGDSSLGAPESTPVRVQGRGAGAAPLGGAGGPQPFAAIPSSVTRHRKSVAAESTPMTGLADLLAVEARRLAEAENRPAYERRDLLADLASRLKVLLEGQSDPAYEPLRALVGTLTGAGELEEKWKAARTALEAFGPGERKPFWKR